MNAPNRASEIKGAITACIAFGTALFGWKGWLAVIWLVCMTLDYLTGSFAAIKNGEWKSSIAREGLWHKLGSIAAVLVSALADIAMGVIVESIELGFDWNSYITPLVLMWYILTELGSILENAAKLGAPVPKWMIDGISKIKDKTDEVGNKLNDDDS